MSSDISSSSRMIAPFNALHAAGEHASEIVAPPYDVVTTDEARARAAGKPKSFLHVSRAEIDLPAGTDAHSDEVYSRAAQNLSALIDGGAMVKSARPTYFVYRMHMAGHSQTGLACGASLAAYAAGTIHRHELTRPDKEDDRVKHMVALDAQTGPVLLAYRPDAALAQVLDDITGRAAAPEIDVTADDGVRHILWAVEDQASLDNIQRAADMLVHLYIADGHHRSAAAARVAKARGETAGRFLAVLFPSDELFILAYNRVVRDLGSLSEVEFLARLDEKYIVTPADAPVQPGQPTQIGLCLKSGWRKLERRDPPSPKAPTEDRIDVALLMSDILKPLLAIKDPRTDPRLDFVGGADVLEKMAKRVSSGAAAAGFALYPTAMDELMAVADSGEIMPPKSTWFEPKLADGLIAHLID